MKPEDVLLFDLEATSADVDTAAIVQVAFCSLAGEQLLVSLVNPLIPIPPESSEIHHILDGDVSDAPTFADLAEQIQVLISGKILAGHNVRCYDTLVLDRHLRAAGGAGIDLDAVLELDTLAADRELRPTPRDLANCLRYWLGDAAIEGAHDALVDVRANARLLGALVDAAGGFDELLDAANRGVDRAGKFRRDDEGWSTYAFSEHRGKRVGDVDPGMLRWMLKKDFPEDTKRHVRRFLDRINQPQGASS